MRYEVPPGLTAEEVHAIQAALDQYFGVGRLRMSAWTLAGRIESLALGALQIRNQSVHPWSETVLQPYTRRGVTPHRGRGDSK